MGDIVSFPGKLTLDALFSMDVDEMNDDELQALLPQIERLYEEVEADEPDDAESEEYYEWSALLEEMDDLMDEIQDRLEE